MSISSLKCLIFSSNYLPLNHVVPLGRHGWLSSSVLLLVCSATLAKYSSLNSKRYLVIHPFRLKTCLRKCGRLPRLASSFLPVSSQPSGSAGTHFCSPSEGTTLLLSLLCIGASQHQLQEAAAPRGSHQVALPAFPLS